MSSLIYIESKTINTTWWQREMPDSQPEEAAAVNSVANHHLLKSLVLNLRSGRDGFNVLNAFGWPRASKQS